LTASGLAHPGCISLLINTSTWFHKYKIKDTSRMAAIPLGASVVRTDLVQQFLDDINAQILDQVDGASDDYDNLEIKRADAAKALAIKNGLLEAGIEKQHAEDKAARIKEYAKNLEEVDVQTELYVAIHEYVTRYEEFLTAQASCWTRWRTFGSTKSSF
jgi:predicted solute-binding protein